MIKHFFNTKSLLFYGSMVGSVILIFKGVSWYGENNLQAPPKLTGEYLLKSENLPSCLTNQNLILNIEQSGIYLSGLLKLSNNNNSKIANENISLNGRYQEDQILFSGLIKSPNNCFNNPTNLTINAQQLNQNSLTGKIIWSEQFPQSNFTAELQLNQENSTPKEH